MFVGEVLYLAFFGVNTRARSKFAPTGWYIFVGEVLYLAFWELKHECEINSHLPVGTCL